MDAQLKAFLAMFHDPRKYGPVALPPALDLEWDQYGMKLANADDRAAYITAARAWLVGIEHALGIRPVIYTGRSYWKEMGNPPDLSDYDLWVASPERTTPRLPTPWPAYRLWQYSHKGDIPGIAGRVDCNAFCGTDAEFAEFVAPRERVFSAS